MGAKLDYFSINLRYPFEDAGKYLKFYANEDSTQQQTSSD